MAGFRTFATGEVLTAENVNSFLMKQSVMVFADAAARTSALGAEVTEGMLTYNEDTAQLEVFDGTNFVPAGAEPPAGIGSNVVSTILTSTFSTSSTTPVTVTGLSATITPSSNTAKVLIIAQIAHAYTSNNTYGVFRLTGGNSGTYIGDAEGSRARGVFGGRTNVVMAGITETGVIVFVDSPATTSATTYGVEVFAQAGGDPVQINRPATDSDEAARVRGASSITVIEVAA